MILFEPKDEIGVYRVLRLLGQGGFGAVYEVEHKNLGVHYALKTFTLEDGHAELFRQRFLAEGKVLARLSHPNIARVFDLDVVDEYGIAFFVMDLIHYKDGESYTLADIEVGGADEDHLVRWFTQLASAIDYIHNEGIIHRDIKLNNILLNDKGGVTLSDFGISKFVGEKIRSEVNIAKTLVSVAGRQVTGNMIMGTEGYMAPEILRGESASVASDTYALGITFFRLLTGIWYEPGTNVLSLLEPFDGVWAEILPRMLDQDPAKRPTNLTALANRLHSVALNASLSRIRTRAIDRPVRSRARRLPWKWILAGIGIAVIGLMVAAWAVLSGGSEIDYSRIYEIPEAIR